MMSEDQESPDTSNGTEDKSDNRSPDNPFEKPEKQEAPVDKAPEAEAPPEEKSSVTGNTDDSINASLDEIEDPTVLRGMVSRLRHENGNHRKKNQEVTKEKEDLHQWKLNNVQAVKAAEEKVVHAEAVMKQYIIKAAAAEYDVDEDLIDLIDGKTEEEIWAKAEKLHNTKKRKPAYEAPTNVELFPGRRGRPVRGEEKDVGGEWLKDFMSK